jgi:hypothetical protein
MELWLRSWRVGGWSRRYACVGLDSASPAHYVTNTGCSHNLLARFEARDVTSHPLTLPAIPAENWQLLTLCTVLYSLLQPSVRLGADSYN